MVDIDVRAHKVMSCNISDEDLNNASFINNLAIVDVDVIEDLSGAKFRTKTVIRRVVSELNKQTFYSIASKDKDVFLSKNTKSITRVNNNFIVEEAVYNFDGVEIFCKYHLFNYVDIDNYNDFVAKGKLPGVPKTTLNDDLVIIDPNNGKHCLFSLSKCDIASQEYTMIDDIDGETFLITDIIAPDKNSDSKDHFLFKIDKNDKRISKVYSRKDKDYMKDDIDYPYIFIKERRMAELKQESDKEESIKYSLGKGNM